MAYVTGSAGDMAAVLAALVSACTSNGWSYAGDVLHKGGVFLTATVAGVDMNIRGFTTFDGQSPSETVRMGNYWNGLTEMSWPATYHISIFEDPDEVYLIVNYGVDRYQFCAFGKSTIADLPGSGMWLAASMCRFNNYARSISSGGAQTSYGSTAFMWESENHVASENKAVHHGLDGGGWSMRSGAAAAVKALTDVLPNAWNSEAVLIPIQVWISRESNKISMVADIQHARYLRIDNHLPGEIVTIGPDRWKCFPFWRKNTIQRNGGSNIDHTGTFGWAIRYDGP